MKKKIRYIKNEDGSKKSVLRFKYDFDDDEVEVEPHSKRRKEKGKRSHRKRSEDNFFKEDEH